MVAKCPRHERGDMLSTVANPKAGRSQSGEDVKFLAKVRLSVIRRAARARMRAEWIGDGREK